MKNENQQPTRTLSTASAAKQDQEFLDQIIKMTEVDPHLLTERLYGQPSPVEQIALDAHNHYEDLRKTYPEGDLSLIIRSELSEMKFRLQALALQSKQYTQQNTQRPHMPTVNVA